MFSHALFCRNAPGLTLSPSVLLIQSFGGRGNNQLPSLAAVDCEKFCEAAPGSLILYMSSQSAFCLYRVLRTMRRSGSWDLFGYSLGKGTNLTLRFGICLTLSCKGGGTEHRGQPCMNFLAYHLIIPSQSKQILLNF